MRPRGPIRGLLLAPLALLAAAVVLLGGADPDSAIPVLQRFLSLDSSRATAYRAQRHLDGGHERMRKTAWMDDWTEADHAGGFRYIVVAQGGSDYIRSKVFLASLEKEREMYATGDPSRAAITLDNYVFGDGGVAPAGLLALPVTPRRKEVLLFDGSIFLTPRTATWCDSRASSRRRHRSGSGRSGLCGRISGSR